jgi:hypothetical protein
VPNAPSEQDLTKALSQITAKAWSDAAFKERLLADPAAVAKEFGVPLPAGMQIKVVEDSPTLRHFVLPPRPAAEELSDEQLEHVAGGIIAVLLSMDSSGGSPSSSPPSSAGCW